MRFLLISSSLSLFLVPTFAGTSLVSNGVESMCQLNKLGINSNVTASWEAESQQNVTQRRSDHNRLREEAPATVWTRELECLVGEENGGEYCVYVNSKFANERGISFFTSPAIAKRVESMTAFTNSDIHEKVNNFTDAPWEIRNIPGRGNGLFATKRLNRGDEILAATPVGVYQSDALYHDFSLGYKYLRKTFDHLPDATKQIFLRMATHNQGDLVMERINTNAFAGDFEGAYHFLLYPETALMNHACRPNAMYRHDQSALIHAAYASQTILPGEEITITYINMLQSRSERQASLKGHWGFECTCSLCSGSASEIQESDAHIQRINELQTMLTDWSESSIATPQMAEEVLQLYEKEHVHAAEGMGHMFAALAFNAVGDVSMAKRHARLAVKAGIANDGSREADEKDMESLRADPKTHWSFMARKHIRGK